MPLLPLGAFRACSWVIFALRSKYKVTVDTRNPSCQSLIHLLFYNFYSYRVLCLHSLGIRFGRSYPKFTLHWALKRLEPRLFTCDST